MAKAQVGGVTFTPSTLGRVENLDQLQMNASGSTLSLEAGKTYIALVDLKDGRTMKAPVTVDLPRPQVTLLSEAVQGNAAELGPVRDEQARTICRWMGGWSSFSNPMFQPIFHATRKWKLRRLTPAFKRHYH